MNDINPNTTATTIPSIGATDADLQAFEATKRHFAELVRDSKAGLPFFEAENNRSANFELSRTIVDEDIVPHSMYDHALLTSRDAFKDAYGFFGDIMVSHRLCTSKDDYKQAYIEAWYEVCLSASESWDVEQAADKAAWNEHLHAISACGYTGTNLERLRKYCVQTIPAVADCPEDYFREDGLSFCGGLEYTMRCSSQREEMSAWLNS